MCLPPAYLVHAHANCTRTWEIAYNALCDPEAAAQSQPLRDFLTSQESVDILTIPWAPLPTHSAQV